MNETKEPPKEPEVKKEAPIVSKKGGKLAVIQVRGTINTKRGVKETLNMLGLTRKNSCVIIDDNPSYKGMLNKVKDIVTWGAIDDATQKLLSAKKSKSKEGKKPVYYLNPPRKGFGRKGVKQPFSIGGALGDRKDKINDLLSRMI
jgi:large subunit ribosomal protein L30